MICTAWNIYSLTFSEKDLPTLPRKASDPQGTGWFSGGTAKAVVLEIKPRAELCGWRRRNRCLRREQKVEEAVGRGPSWEGDRVRGCWQPPTLVLSRSGLGFHEARACLKHLRESCPSFHLLMAFFFHCFLNWLIRKVPSLNSEHITTSKTFFKMVFLLYFTQHDHQQPAVCQTSGQVQKIKHGPCPKDCIICLLTCKGIGPFKPKAWGSSLAHLTPWVQKCLGLQITGN